MIQHQRIPHFVLQAGLLLLAQLYFSGLGLAAAQPEQHLYAGIQSKLYEFSLDGKFRIYATLPGVLSGFDVDEDGTFWATTGNKLYRVDRHSNESPATVQNKGVTEFANGLGQCRGMAIGPNGDFWIADRGKGDRSIGIIKIDRQTGEKTLIKEKSDEVKGNIYSVERGPNGNLYASAQSGHTVTEFKPDGTPVRGTPEKPEPLISGHGAAGHRAIVFDVNGDILFIGVDGIERFDSNGTHLGTFFKWTGEGFNDGKLDRADFIARGAKHPMDLAVDQNGIVYGSDNGYDKKKGQEVGGAIYRYNKDGSRELFFEAGPRPNYLTFWPRTRYSHSPESGALNKSKAAEPSESSSNALPSFPDWQCLYVGDFVKACSDKITSDKKVSVDEADESCSMPDETPAATAADEAVIAKLLEGIIPGPPKRESGKDGAKLVWEKSPLLIKATLSKETGRILAINTNGVPMTNDRLRLLAQLAELRDLNYGHSGEWHFKDIPLSDFDGSGLEALADSKIESLHIGGSRFGKPGELAIAKMKNLRRLTLRHLPLSEEGMTAIGKQSGLREFGIGLSHDMGRNIKLAEVIPLFMANPNLQRLFIQEAFLKWDNGLSTIAEKGSKLEKIEFGRGSVVFPDDIDRLKKALPNAEIVTETYDQALHGNKFYESRLKAVMTKDEFARLLELAGK